MRERKNYRQQILERDYFTCQCCGASGLEETLEVHHIHPLVFDGPDEPDNLIALCPTCHAFAPNDPDRFLNYQRMGGAVRTFLRGQLVEFTEDQASEIRECERSSRLQRFEKSIKSALESDFYRPKRIPIDHAARLKEDKQKMREFFKDKTEAFAYSKIAYLCELEWSRTKAAILALVELGEVETVTDERVTRYRRSRK